MADSCDPKSSATAVSAASMDLDTLYLPVVTIGIDNVALNYGIQSMRTPFVRLNVLTVQNEGGSRNQSW